MKTLRHTILPAVCLVLLAGCDYNEHYFEGMEQSAVPTDLLDLDKTLTAADYEAIATNAANVALAGNAGKTELEALKKNGYFTEAIPAEKYLPNYFAALYPGADDKSAIRATYRTTLQTETARTVNHAAHYTLSVADYAAAWGKAYPFFAPSKPAAEALPSILAQALPDAEEGASVYAWFNVAGEEPAGAEYAFDANFEDMWHQNVSKVALEGWTNLSVKGANKWDLKAFRGNNYLQASAYENKDEMEVYLISPEMAVGSGMELTFDACYGNYREEGGRIRVLLTDDLQAAGASVTRDEVEAATWHDITSSVDIPVPSGTYGTLANVCRYDLSAYAGRKLRIAFLYTGDESETEVGGQKVKKQATTTVQIDNVSVRSAGYDTETYIVDALLYRFDGTEWKPFTEGYAVSAADMSDMGFINGFFDATTDPAHYLPLLLRQRFPYPALDERITTVCKYYGRTGGFRADDFRFDGTNWVWEGVVDKTAQYVKNNGTWLYDPNVLVTLLPVKGDVTSIRYYQTICDWVGANKGAQYFQTGYTNAEYYYGASSYQCNMDFKIDSWRSKCTADYSSYSDEELEKLQYERLEEAFLPALEKLHADVAPVEGMDVLVTIRFGVYTGTGLAACNYEIVYKAVGKGAFEFVSLDPIGGED